MQYNKPLETILVRDLKVGDTVLLTMEQLPYTVTKINRYGNSSHSLILEFDKLLPDGMADWVFDTLTRLTLAE